MMTSPIQSFEVLVLLIIILIIALFAVTLFFIRYKRKEEALDAIISRMSQEIVLLEELESFSSKIKKILIENLEAENVSIILYNDEIEDYLFVNVEDKLKGIKHFKAYNDFFLFLETNDSIIDLKKLEKDNSVPSYVQRQGLRYLQAVNALMCIPLIFERRIIGIMNIEKKKTGARYTNYDYEMINRLRREITVGYTNSLLFAKMSRLFEQVEEQNEKLSMLSRSNTRFIIGIGRELRGPLFSMKSKIDSFLKHKDVSPSQRHSFHLMLKDIRRIQRLMQSLVLYSQIRSRTAEIRREDFNIIRLIKECIDEEKEYAKSKGLELTYQGEEEATIFGDPEKIRLAMLNLISNAIKFTQEGFVKVSAEKREDAVEVTIEDSGIGLSEEKRKHIFENDMIESAQVSENYGGTGLSLAIVKSILDLHNTTLTVDSEINKGSVFSFKLSSRHER